MPKKGLIFPAFLEKWTYVWMLVFLAALTFSTALLEIASVAAFIGWGLQKLRHRSSLPFEKKVWVPLLGFLLLSVVSFFWSEFPRQSFRGIFKVLQQVLIFWVVAESFASPARLRYALIVLTASFVLLGLDGIWQYVFGTDLLRQISFEPASAGPRITASFRNYGLLASYLLLFLLILFTRLDRKRYPWSFPVSAFAMAAGFLLLFWTRLRGAWVAFIGGLVFFLWFAGKRRYLILLFLALGAGFLLLPRSMIIHIDMEGKEQSLIERAYLWDRALRVIAARPLTGTGINTYSVAHQKYDLRQNWRVRNYYSHNGYLQIAAETGVPSLACFLAFLLFYFQNALRNLSGILEESDRVALIGILAGMVNFLILGLIDTVFHNPQAVMAFWLLAGWGVAYQNVLLKNQSVSAPTN